MNVAGVGDGSGYGGLAGDAPAAWMAVPVAGTGRTSGFGGDVFEPSTAGLEAEVGAAELGRIRAALTQIVEMSPVAEGEADPIRGVLRQVEAALGAAGMAQVKNSGVAADWLDEDWDADEMAKLFGKERPSVLDAALVKLAVYEKAAPVEAGTAVVDASAAAEIPGGSGLVASSLAASSLGAAEAARLASQFELTRRAEVGWRAGSVERPRLVERAGLAEGDGRRRKNRRGKGAAAGRAGDRRERRGRVGLAAFCGAIGRAGLGWLRRLFGERRVEPRGFASQYNGEE